MNAATGISIDANKSKDALAHLSPDRARLIGSREAQGRGEVIERRSPAHDVLITPVPRGSADDARSVIAAARAAFDKGPWPEDWAINRARVLLRAGDRIDRDRQTLAILVGLESGRPIAQARGEIEGAADIWRYTASLARGRSGESYANLGSDRLGVLLREPTGAGSIITPWNFPLLVVSQKLPFALAAGCTCVVKPSEMTSATTLHLGSLRCEAGLPDGVCNIVTGYGPEVGAPMTTDPDVDMIFLTGLTAVGRAAIAAEAATLKKVSMELGGRNPQIIFPDADMDAALDAAGFGAYVNAGKCCNAGSRVLLHTQIADEFLSELAHRAKTVKVGDPLDADTRVGAIISAGHRVTIEGHLKTARANGAELRAGGARLESSGLFMAPTIVERVGASMAIAREGVCRALSRSPSKLWTRSSSWRIQPPTAFRRASGVATSTRNRRRAQFAPARSASTPSWTEPRSCPSADIASLASARELGRHAVKDYAEEKTFPVPLARAPAGGSHAEPEKLQESGTDRRFLNVGPECFRREQRVGRVNNDASNHADGGCDDRWGARRLGRFGER